MKKRINKKIADMILDSMIAMGFDVVEVEKKENYIEIKIYLE